ncbi:ankyrin repeat domain-containing protein, partial [Mycena vulgaris]
KILEWMSPLNSFQRQADIFSNWQPGTGGWLLADAKFKEWKSVLGQVLWCRGMPGAGKTVLASLIVNHLEAQVQNNIFGLACLYLNHKELEAQTLLNLLGSLWRQLVWGKSMPSSIVSLHEHHREKHTRPPIDEVYRALTFIITQYSKVYIVVDALDEYPEEPRTILLKYLSMLPVANVLVTSRPHINLDLSFHKMQILDIYATEDDIRQYVAKNISESTRLSRHVRARPELKDQIQSKILSNAQGMFLLAKLHIDSLVTKTTVKAVREALQSLPTDLKGTYDEAMERIDHQSKDDQQLARLALTWVANVKRLLSVAELREALAIEPEATSLDPDNLLDIDIILSVCAGLIMVDETASVVRLIHYTTQDYMDSIQPHRFPDAQTEITSRCLAYLSCKEFQNLPQWPSNVGPSRAQISAQKILVALHPFLKYSQYCLVHAAGQPEAYLHNKIISFLEQASIWENFWINNGADVNMGGGYYETALNTALAYDHHTVVQILLKNGADVNMQKGYAGSALHIASEKGDEAMVQLLIENGANINAQGGQYGSALQAASCKGHQAVVQKLLEKGANVDMLGGSYSSALQAALNQGHVTVAHLLIKNGANVNIQDKAHLSPLQAACLGDDPQLIQLLIENGADVNHQGGEHGSALQAASAMGKKLIVQLLIELGADVNLAGGKCGSALQAASYCGHEVIVQFLIKNGADVNASGGEYGSALEAALAKGNIHIAKLLIDQGAAVNAQSEEYGLALQTASAKGAKDMVQFLIELGADVN